MPRPRPALTGKDLCNGQCTVGCSATVALLLPVTGIVAQLPLRQSYRPYPNPIRSVRLWHDQRAISAFGGEADMPCRVMALFAALQWVIV